MVRFSRVLIDLSGTLHVEDVATPNAVAALKKLRGSGRHVRFVTNTTKESGRALHDRLTRLNFEIDRREIFSSLSAASRLVERQKLNPLYLLSESALEEFNLSDDVDTQQDTCQEAAAKNAVVLGLAPELFHYEKLTEAMQVLQRDESNQLIAIHKAKYYARSRKKGTSGNRPDGQITSGDQTELALGPGAIAAALEYSTGRTATVVGKPTRQFYLSAIRDLLQEIGGEDARSAKAADQDVAFASVVSDGFSGVLSDKDVLGGTLMIGDDATDDVAGPLSLGMGGAILVKTGKYREGDELTVKPRVQELIISRCAQTDSGDDIDKNDVDKNDLQTWLDSGPNPSEADARILGGSDGRGECVGEAAESGDVGSVSPPFFAACQNFSEAVDLLLREDL